MIHAIIAGFTVGVDWNSVGRALGIMFAILLLIVGAVTCSLVVSLVVNAF